MFTAYMAYLFIFVLGTVIGSFLNVCIYRLPLDKSIAKPRSFCPNCGTTLAAADLVPVLSYLFCKARCRYCARPISPRYMLVELLTGMLFLLLYIRFGLSYELPGYLILTALLLIAFFVDIDHQIIPDQISLGGIAAAVLLDILLLASGAAVIPVVDISLASFNLTLPGSVIGALAGGLLFLGIAEVAGIIFKAEALGGGDVKLAGTIGGFLGWKLALLSFVLAFVAGAVCGLLLLAFKLKGRRDYIPFGPYMVVGALTAVFYGSAIINGYLAFYYPG